MELFTHVKPSSIDEIASFTVMKHAIKGEHLFRDKDDVTNIYLLVSGTASLYKVNSLGEKKVIFVFGKGQLLNEVMLQDLPSSINCEMLEESWVLVIPIKKLWRVMTQDAELTKAILDSMALKIRRLYRQLKNTTNALTGEKRLAAKLFKLSKDYGIQQNNGIMIDIDLTITYLAEMLGSKRETVSRQMKKLVEMGLISMQKNKIIVLDQTKLSDYFKSP